MYSDIVSLLIENKVIKSPSEKVIPFKKNLFKKITLKSQILKNKKPGTTGDRLKKVFRHFIDNSTFHGLNRFVNKDNGHAMKLMWFLFILIFFIFMCLFVGDGVKNYYKFNVLTRLNHPLSQQLTLPTFTFCVAINNEYTLGQMLVSCRYNQDKLCTADDFELFEIVMTDIDSSHSFEKKKCYIINKLNGQDRSKLIYSDSTGYKSGLTILLLLPSADDFLNFVITDNGATAVWDEMGYVLISSLRTNLILDRKDYSKLPHPHNDCGNLADVEESWAYKKTLEKNVVYRQLNCHELCVFERLSVLCNCSVALDNSCSLQCLQLEYAKINPVELCKQSCPLECTLTKHTIEKEFFYFSEDNKNRNLSSHKTINKILNALEHKANLTHLTDAEIMRRALEINIFYKSRRFEDLTESEALTKTELISDIGGLLGLFLGISFLSLVEFIDLFFKIIWILIAFKLKKSAKCLWSALART